MQRLQHHVEMKKGDPLHKISGALVMEIQHILEDIEVVGGGHIERQSGANGYGWKILITEFPTAGPGSFSGRAYVAGIKTDNLNQDSAKPWVKCKLSNGVATEELGPPPEKMPDDEEWYEKNRVFGDIHESRA